MRTFEEACRATIIREELSETADNDRMFRQIEEALERRADILHQAQTSQEAALLVIAIHQMNQRGVSISDCIRIAFANGVIVGIEMEKQELPNLAKP